MNIWNMLKRKRKDQRKIYGWCKICRMPFTKEGLVSHFGLVHSHIKMEG